MKVEQRKIDEVTPYGKNAKKHSDKQVKQIAASIQEFGFNQPIVVDKEGVVIVGHGRLAAARFLNLTTVPVLTVEITEEKAKAYRLADNRLNESEWDMKLVIEELKSISMPMLDLTGFNRKLVLDSDKWDDAVPKLPVKPRSKEGDLFELGEHRVLCGDSTRIDHAQKLMGKEKADMVFTDPPYNVNYVGKGENTQTGILNDKMDDAKFLQFLKDAFAVVRESTKGGAGMYIFHSDKTQLIFEQAINLSGLEVKNQLIWNKPSGGMGMGDYRSKHEPFFYVNVKGQKPQFYGDRTNVTVVDFQKTDEQLMKWAKQVKEAEKDGKTTIWTMKREPTQDYVHPTQKPVELVMYALHNSSKVG